MCNKLPNCPYGKKCRFAHSEKELRHVTRDDKYKTVRCKNYDKTSKWHNQWHFWTAQKYKAFQNFGCCRVL